MATLEQLYGHLKTLVTQWVHSKEEINSLLNNKVDKEAGKGLSSEDYTSTEKTKLAGIETEANKTVVDSTFVSNSENPVQSKVIKSALDSKAGLNDLHAIATSGSYLDLDNIPSTFAPSTHTHSASEVTDSNAYSNIGTSADSSQSAINYAIDNKIGALLNADLLVLETTLPTASSSTMNKFYLVPETNGKTHDEYEIYITVETDDNGTPSYAWEKVDTTTIDLNNYVTTNDARLSDARTPLSHTHGDITNDGKIGNQSGKVLVTGSGGAITVSDTITEMDNTFQALITYGASLDE